MITINDKNILTLPCEDVISDEVSDIISKLEEELAYSNKIGNLGIGLAAPQIGIYKKAAIIRLGEVSINLVNAKIEKYYDLHVFSNEGCLSFPNQLKITNRYNEIYVTNNLVYPNSFIATGIISVVCQHEIDHFNGLLMFDREYKNINPNEPCSCGKKDLITGKVKKYKKCCGRL